MPILKIDTNLPVQHIPDDFNVKATKTICEVLSKPTQSVTVIVDSNKRLTIGGSNEPAALVELRSIGGLKGPNGTKVVEALTKLIQEELKLPIDRFYINLFDLDPEQVAYKGELRSVTLSR